MKRFFILIFLFPFCTRAQQSSPPPDKVSQEIFSLSMVMMHDVVNPPAASRYYAYSMLAAYDIVAQNNPGMTPAGQLIKKYQPVAINANNNSYNYKNAALYAILEAGKLLLPSGYTLQEEEDKLVAGWKQQKMPPAMVAATIKVGQQAAANVLAFSKTDNYFKLSTLLRYTPVKGDGYWFPTPPAYMEAIEPNWKTIRPLIIDSCNQFPPAPPTEFSKDSNSVFYKMAMEVYTVSNKASSEQLTIAGFWDCNPFVVASSGHMSLGFKKMSPGGHWMNITGIAAKKGKLDFDRTILLHAMVSFTLMDAFISCWDEKYRSNRIRPESYINRYIDSKWMPLLQTPPFPEYTSGHSVISTASAEILTYLLGDNFSFTDDSEKMFELEARRFTSFRAAAAEAAISRLYGGIHFRDAIENGQQEGRMLAQKVIEKFKTAGILPLAAAAHPVRMKTGK